MRRLLKRLLAVLLGLISLVLVSVIVLVLFLPQALINNWTVERVLTLLNERQIVTLNWADMDIQVGSVDLALKSWSIHFEDLCVDEELAAVCVGTFRASGVLDIRPWHWALPHLGPVQIAGLDGRIHLPPEEPEPKDAPLAAEPLRPLEWLKILEDMTVDPIDIQISRLLIDRGEERLLELTAQLRLSGLHQNNADSLTLVASGRLGGEAFNVDTKLDILSYEKITDPEAAMVLVGEVRHGRNRVHLDLRFDPMGINSERDLKAELRYRSPPERVDVNLAGLLSAGDFRGEFSLAAHGFADGLVNLDLRPCRLSFNWQNGLDEGAAFGLNCAGQVGRGHMPNENIVGRFIPGAMNFSWNSEGSYRQGIDGDAYRLKSSLKLEQQSNGPLRLGGELTLVAAKGEDEASPALDLQTDLTAAIDSFEVLVSSLADTDWAVPAPINQLRGDTVCRMRGRYLSQGQQDIFPLSCRMDLEAERQAFKADFEARLILSQLRENMQIFLDADLNLRLIEVQLPELSLTGDIPKLAPDNRFVMEQPPRDLEQVFARDPVASSNDEPSNFNYNIRINSPRSDTVVIHSNLLPQSVPLAPRLELDSKLGIEGSVAIEDHSLSLFRRQARVERLAVEFRRDQEEMPISGRVDFDTPDYNIRMNVFGTTSEPGFMLESEPPLPERDIYAILLFGRKPEGLESDKVRSVAETRAAIADGAINLLSMYYLAATPIESVGYNPHDGVFSARVRLQDDLALTVGTGVDQAGGEIGLRKRFGNWSIETRAVRGAEDEPGRGVAMLRWALRY